MTEARRRARDRPVRACLLYVPIVGAKQHLAALVARRRLAQDATAGSLGSTAAPIA